MKRILLVLMIGFVSSAASANPADRWYTEKQVDKGEVLFKQNCASCHGQNAEATPNWKQTDANGKYPPPPLNGTAHAWHHDLELLRRTVREGGQKLGGVMPPFSDKMSTSEIDAVIAYFQSKWPDDLYSKWAKNFQQTKLPSLDDVGDLLNKSITRHLRKRLGNVEIDDPEQTAIDGVWQVKLQNRYVYLMDGGKHAMIGDLVDLENGQNLTELARRNNASKAIKEYRDSDLVVYTPDGEEKATLDIFTDTSCPYCQKLHQEMSHLLDAGIKVRYLPFPRGGVTGPGYKTLRSVWCAEDRTQAMDDAKSNVEIDDGIEDCELAAVVDRAYKSGNEIGVTGTPALFKSDGQKIEGYVPYQQLIPMILK